MVVQNALTSMRAEGFPRPAVISELHPTDILG